MPRVDCSVFGVVVREGKVLMVLNVEKPMVEKLHEPDPRRAFFHKPRGWGCPGGGMERGESVSQTVRREVLEEAGIRVSVDELTTMLRLPVPNSHQKVYFLIEEFEGEPHVNSAEVSEVAWIPLEVIVGCADEKESRAYWKDARGEELIIYKGHCRAIRQLLHDVGIRV